jgi:hypothetical protein
MASICGWWVPAMLAIDNLKHDAEPSSIVLEEGYHRQVLLWRTTH